MSQNDIFNLDYTNQIFQLCQIPFEQRSDQWVNAFFQFIPTASMACADPQIIVGPDKLPYFVLNLPTPGASFESFSVSHLLEFVTDNGLGIAINPAKGSQPDWIFSAGDLWNFRETNIFIFDQARWENLNADEQKVNLTEREVLLAQPSESYLPKYVRKNIDQTLRDKFGITEPAVFLMTDMTLNPSMNLVFNIFNENENPAKIQDIINYLAWSLPRDYGLVGIDSTSELVSKFEPLISQD